MCFHSTLEAKPKHTYALYLIYTLIALKHYYQNPLTSIAGRLGNFQKLEVTKSYRSR